MNIITMKIFKNSVTSYDINVTLYVYYLAIF
jgi:hypothetical protein